MLFSAYLKRDYNVCSKHTIQKSFPRAFYYAFFYLLMFLHDLWSEQLCIARFV